MSYYDEIMRQAMTRANLVYGIENEGDYYEDDGRGHQVLYCQQCNEPKQFWIFRSTEPHIELEQRIEAFAYKHQGLSYEECREAIMNDLPPKKYIKELNKVVGVPCKCQRDYKDGLPEKSEERRLNIKKNKYACFPAVEMQRICFDDYEENKHIKACRKYAKQFRDMRADGKCMLLCGAGGAGKTIAAICLANELLNREYCVGFKLQAEITAVPISKREELFNELMQYSLLIIDDLNLQPLNDNQKDFLFYILESRIKAKMPIVFTSNIKKESLHKAEGLDKRILDRIADSNTFYVIEDSTHNYRESKLWI